MVINYKMTQKTILRVSPRVPLSEHLPAICEKCEFDVESTVLLRDVHSLAPLDMSHSLNDYAIREVYARDTKGKNKTFSRLKHMTHSMQCCNYSVILPQDLLLLCIHPLQLAQVLLFANKLSEMIRAVLVLILTPSMFVFVLGTVTPGKNKNQKEEENKGLFSLFRRSKKKSYQVTLCFHDLIMWEY